MSYSVYKYEVPVGEHVDIEIPQGAEILSVQTQNDQPCIWALVDKRAPMERRKFRIAGTGHSIDNPNALTFIGTFQMHGGSLVFHLFEYGRNNE